MSDRPPRRWTAGALIAVIVAVVTAVSVGGDDGDSVPIPSTTLPPSTTTTVGPWEAAGFDPLPRVHSEVAGVGAQLVAYHTVETDGSVHVVVVDMAEARVAWRREVEFPDRIPGIALPPPAFQESQNLIHVVIDEAERAPESPLPGAEPEDPTPTPTPDPDADPELAVVGIDVSDGFGITDVPFDLEPRELPSMCGEVVCFEAIDIDGSAVLALVDPSTGSVRVATAGFRRALATDGPEAVTVGDSFEDDFRGEIVATDGYRSTEVWRSTIDEVFGGADVSPDRGWASLRAADGSWVLWLPASVDGPVAVGDTLPAGAVAVVRPDGTSAAVLEGSLCRGLDVATDVAVTAVPVCDGRIVVESPQSLSSPSARIRLVDPSDGSVVTTVATPAYDDFRAATRVDIVADGVFVVDTGEGFVRIDLVEGSADAVDGEPVLAWCVGSDDGSDGVPVPGADGLREFHRVVDPVFPCTPTLGEVPAAGVGELLEAGDLAPDEVGFVRSGEWVVWVGGDRQLRAVRLG